MSPACVFDWPHSLFLTQSFPVQPLGTRLPFMTCRLTLLLLTLQLSFTSVAEILSVSNFATTGLEGWKTESFKGQTRYQLLDNEQQRVLSAISENSASGLFRRQRVDLEKTPWLNWRWQVKASNLKADEHSKAGDDYAARVYVVVDGGLFIWRTRAINYVWASTSAKGTHWPNAFAGKHAMMLALQDGTTPLDEWREEKRNVRKDFKQLHDKDVRYIDVIAIMTDTDNSGGQAEALYGDLYFSAE